MSAVADLFSSQQIPDVNLQWSDSSRYRRADAAQLRRSRQEMIKLNYAESAAEAEFRSELRLWLQQHSPVGSEPDYSSRTTLTFEQQREWSTLLYDHGWIGLTWPAAYGGRDLPLIYQNIFLQEMARAGAPRHVNAGPGLSFVGPTIMAAGTDEQRGFLLPALLSGQDVWCQCFSEPESGSDLASVRTTARSDGQDVWIVNGSKVWSTRAHVADKCIVLARSVPGSRRHDGLSLLIVDVKAPGVTVTPLPHLTGEHEFNQVEFDDVQVPGDSLLGEPGQGWSVAMTVLRHERGTTAMQLAADFEVQLRRFVDFVGAQRLDNDPFVQLSVTEAWARLQALSHTNLRMLSTVQNGEVPGPESSITKIAWSETNQMLTATALDLILSANGASNSDWAEVWQYEALRARGNSIEAGTSEVLKNIVAERVLGLPRSR